MFYLLKGDYFYESAKAARAQECDEFVKTAGCNIHISYMITYVVLVASPSLTGPYFINSF